MKKIFLLTSLLALSLFLLAEDNLTKNSKQDSLKRHYKLEGIRVIAEKPEESIGSIEVKRFALNEALREVNVSEALDDVSGLDLTVGGKEGSNLTIRGFKEEEIKILVDGRPVSSSYMDAVDLTTIPLANIKEIQVLKGPVSSLYGSNTMGGVVNIITQSPSKKREIVLGTQVRRNNTNKFYLSASQNLGRMDYWLYASRYNTDGMVLSNDFIPTAFENGDIRNHAVRTQYDFQGKVNFDLYDFHKIGLQLGYTQMPTKEIISNIYEDLNRQFTDWERLQGSLIGMFQLRYNLQINSSIYYDQYSDTYVEYRDPNYEEVDPRFPSYLESWTFGTNQKVDWDVTDDLRLMSGLRFEKRAFNRKDNANYINWTTNNTRQFDYYFQSQYDLNNFSFSLGSGVSVFKATANENWKAHLQPSGGIYYTSPQNTKISIAASVNTSYPTLRQLYSSSSGNENLKEESAFKSEITLKQPFVVSRFAGSVGWAVFYNDVTNLISRIGGIQQNVNKVESYGQEIELKLKLGWEHEIDYSWIKYRDNSNEVLLGTPEHRITISESFELPGKIRLKYKASWKDKRLTEEGGILPAYSLHAIYLNHTLGKLKLGFGVENLLDKNYEDEYGYPGEGINFIVNLEMKI